MVTIEQLFEFIGGHWKGDGDYQGHAFTQEDTYERFNGGAFIRCETVIRFGEHAMPAFGIYAVDPENDSQYLFWYYAHDGSYSVAAARLVDDLLTHEGITHGGQMAGPWKSTLKKLSDTETEFEFYHGDGEGNWNKGFHFRQTKQG